MAKAKKQEKKPVKKEIKKEVKKPEFEAILQVNLTEIRAKGDTAIEALDNLQGPVLFHTGGVLILKKGKKEAKKALNVPQMRQFFADKTLRIILRDNLSIQIK